MFDQLLKDACMFRLNQASPLDPSSITISRDVFDELVRVVELAARTSAVHPACHVSLKCVDDKCHATASSDVFGTVQVEGRTTLEAMDKINQAHWKKTQDFMR